jgi:hypothetical protein
MLFVLATLQTIRDTKEKAAAAVLAQASETEDATKITNSSSSDTRQSAAAKEGGTEQGNSVSHGRQASRRGAKARAAGKQDAEGASPLQDLSRSSYPWRQRGVRKAGAGSSKTADSSASEAGKKEEAVPGAGGENEE